jgi:hypothetical protein
MVEPGEELPRDGSLYLLGGGEDNAQTTAVRELRRGGELFDALGEGAVLFAVCAGYQICGHTFTIGENDEVREGLGLLDVETRRGPVRAVGEILTRWTKPDGTTSQITGFENHGGYTTLGPEATPLARVEVGIGNDGRGTEGASRATSSPPTRTGRSWPATPNWPTTCWSGPWGAPGAPEPRPRRRSPGSVASGWPSYADVKPSDSHFGSECTTVLSRAHR